MSDICVYISLGWNRDAQLCINHSISSSDSVTNYIINAFGQIFPDKTGSRFRIIITTFDINVFNNLYALHTMHHITCICFRVILIKINHRMICWDLNIIWHVIFIMKYILKQANHLILSICFLKMDAHQWLQKPILSHKL